MKRPASTPASTRRWVFQAVIVLVFALALSVVLLHFRKGLEGLGDLGYLGVAIIMLVNNATILLPAVGQAVLVASAQVLNPWLLGVAGGIGGAFGELTGYVLGRSGHGAIAESRLYHRVQQYMRWTGPVLFVFALTPLPFDVVGILAGTMRYPIWRFLFWTAIGKVLQMVILAVASYYAFGWVFRVFGIEPAG